MGSRNKPQSSHHLTFFSKHQPSGVYSSHPRHPPGHFLSFISAIILYQILNKRAKLQVAMAAPVTPTAEKQKKSLLPTVPSGELAKEQQQSIKLAAKSRTPAIGLL